MTYNIESSQRNYQGAGVLATAGLAGLLFLGGCSGNAEVRTNTFESLYATKKVREAERSGTGAASGEAILNANLLRNKITAPTAADKVRVANDVANNYFDEAVKLTDETPRKDKLAGAKAVLDYIVTPRDHDGNASTPEQSFLDDTAILLSDKVAVYDTIADVELERLKLGVTGVTLETVVSAYNNALNSANGNEEAKEALRGHLRSFAGKLEDYLNAKDVAKTEVDNQKAARKTAFQTLFGNVFTAVGNDASRLAKASELWSVILDNSTTANGYATTVAGN